MKAFIPLLVSALLLAACSSFPTLDIRTKPVDAPKPPERPMVPDPQPIQTAPFKFRVLTADRIQAIIPGAKCEPATKGDKTVTCVLPRDWVFYLLAVKDYETLARNTADILRWVKDAKWRLRYYRGEDVWEFAAPDVKKEKTNDVPSESSQPEPAGRSTP